MRNGAAHGGRGGWGGIPAGIEPCPSFIDSATRWRADSRSVVFISRFSFPFGICLPIPTVHLVRLLGAVTTCGLWGDLVGWPLFILLPRAEKKDIYLKLIHHQHVLSFFFFYFNIQMALIARVAEFFFLSKVRHHSQSSHQVEFFGASICSGQRMANTRESRRMSVDSPPPPSSRTEICSSSRGRPSRHRIMQSAVAAVNVV